MGLGFRISIVDALRVQISTQFLLHWYLDPLGPASLGFRVGSCLNIVITLSNIPHQNLFKTIP